MLKGNLKQFYTDLKQILGWFSSSGSQSTLKNMVKKTLILLGILKSLSVYKVKYYVENTILHGKEGLFISCLQSTNYPHHPSTCFPSYWKCCVLIAHTCLSTEAPFSQREMSFLRLCPCWGSQHSVKGQYGGLTLVSISASSEGPPSLQSFLWD